MCPWARHLSINCFQCVGQNLAWQQPLLVLMCKWVNEKNRKVLWGDRMVLEKALYRVSALSLPFR